VGNGLFAPVFALLIYALAVESRGLGWVLSLPVVALLGEASYGLYLLHVPVFWWVDRLAHLLPDGGAWLFGRRWFGVVDVVVAVAISVAAFWWIERPGRRMIRRLLDPARRAPSTPPAGVGRQGLALGGYSRLVERS
jgi:peptidoglycan/LPS O-acetylase OafA/YrhL